MKACPIEPWYAPTNLENAVTYLQKYPECNVLAGGTDLLVKCRENVGQLPALMGLERIEELKEIHIDKEKIRFGAMVTHREIVDHARLRNFLPALAVAAESIGSVQIRNRGTIGGNIVNASPAADLVPPLIAASAVVEIVSCGSIRRRIPLEDFFQGPGITRLQPGEIVAVIECPMPGPYHGSCFRKKGKRKALSISTATVAVAVELHSNKAEVRNIRISLGSLGPIPIRARQTEKVLLCGGINNLALAEEALEYEMHPISDMRGSAKYRRQIARDLLHHTVMESVRQAEDKRCLNMELL